MNCNNSNTEPDNESKLLTFIRRKYLGRITIFHLVTEVRIKDEEIALKKHKVIFYIFKKKPIEVKYNIAEISSLAISRTIDKSNAIFAAIFFILGFFNPILFIMTALLIFLGIGKEIKIKMNNGEIISIPSEFNKGFSKLSDLIDLLLPINKNIVIQQKLK